MRRPVRFTLGVVGAVILVNVAASILSFLIGVPAVFVGEALLIAGGGAVFLNHGGLGAAGIEARPWGRSWAVAAPLFLPAVVMLAVALVLGQGWAVVTVPSFLLLSLLVGVSEEILFRGLVYGALRQLGAGRAVLGSAVAFGLLHALDPDLAWVPILVLLRVLNAFAMGCAFAAVLERTGRLVPLILAHATVDFFGFVALSSTTYVPGIAALAIVLVVTFAVLLGGYAWWLMRRPVPRVTT